MLEWQPKSTTWRLSNSEIVTSKTAALYDEDLIASEIKYDVTEIVANKWLTMVEESLDDIPSTYSTTGNAVSN